MKKDIHIALIPDGNRRYAQKIGKPNYYGHFIGAKKIREFINWCIDYDNIKMVSIYALSTENMNRKKKELEYLWNLYKKEFTRLKKEKSIREKEIKINVFGNEEIWRDDVKQVAKDIMCFTASYSRKIVNILLSYGSKFEIINAIKKIISNKLKTSNIMKCFDDYLLVSKPVDLVIRTGGYKRLSNFLLLQSAYAEIYFTNTLWPEFTKIEFDSIMNWFYKQQRNFGR